MQDYESAKFLNQSKTKLLLSFMNTELSFDKINIF
jgi:hypothetical protein